MVWGSFWPKLVKSSVFKPNGRHEQFRSAFFIGKSSVGSPKALTRVRFVTNRGDLLFPKEIYKNMEPHPPSQTDDLNEKHKNTEGDPP